VDEVESEAYEYESSKPEAHFPSSNCAMRAKTKKLTRINFFSFHASSSITIPPFSIDGFSRPDDSFCSVVMGKSSRPQSLSMFVWSWTCRMPRLDTNPAPVMPSTTCQTTLSASPNVFCTSFFNGCSSIGIEGIAAKASSTPSGNCARNETGSVFFNSFCRIAPPTVTPQIFAVCYLSVGKSAVDRSAKDSRIQNFVKTRRAPSRGLTV
jgi:hypothetical protein